MLLVSLVLMVGMHGAGAVHRSASCSHSASSIGSRARVPDALQGGRGPDAWGWCASWCRDGLGAGRNVEPTRRSGPPSRSTDPCPAAHAGPRRRRCRPRGRCGVLPILDRSPLSRGREFPACRGTGIGHSITSEQRNTRAACWRCRPRNAAATGGAAFTTISSRDLLPLAGGEQRVAPGDCRKRRSSRGRRRFVSSTGYVKGTLGPILRRLGVRWVLLQTTSTGSMIGAATIDLRPCAPIPICASRLRSAVPARTPRPLGDSDAELLGEESLPGGGLRGRWGSLTVPRPRRRPTPSGRGRRWSPGPRWRPRGCSTGPRRLHRSRRQ